MDTYSIPTERQQLDALWAALHDPKFWMSVNTVHHLVLHKASGVNEIGDILRTFAGTRVEALSQLIAYQTAQTLDSAPRASTPALSGVFDGLGRDGYF
jgi:hypothetical protein